MSIKNISIILVILIAAISRFIPHRVSCQSEEDLIFIETQTGEYFGEDDIVRLEDDYDRQ